MNIGLISVDGHNNFPNLALMKIPTFHKKEGDFVEWCNPNIKYDCVYASKVLIFTPDIFLKYKQMKLPMVEQNIRLTKIYHKK